MPHRHFWRCGTRQPVSPPRPHTPLSHFRIPTPHQTPPAPFWCIHSFASSGSAPEVSARQDATGERYDPLPYPLYARLLPRLACALNRPLFVHFVQTTQAPPVLTLRSKNIVSKIVQICAFFCKKRTAIAAHFGFTKLASREAHNNLLAYRWLHG